MANPFVKAWRYLMALFNSKIDEHADPKVQIQQAIEDAQRLGHLRQDAEAAQLAFELHALELGCNWQRQLLRDEKANGRARTAMLARIDALTTPASRRAARA